MLLQLLFWLFCWFPDSMFSEALLRDTAADSVLIELYYKFTNLFLKKKQYIESSKEIRLELLSQCLNRWITILSESLWKTIAISLINHFYTTLMKNSSLWLHFSLFRAIFEMWKQNLPLKCAIFDVFLSDVCRLRSRQTGKFVHATECENIFDQTVANLP